MSGAIRAMVAGVVGITGAAVLAGCSAGGQRNKNDTETNAVGQVMHKTGTHMPGLGDRHWQPATIVSTRSFLTENGSWDDPRIGVRELGAAIMNSWDRGTDRGGPDGTIDLATESFQYRKDGAAEAYYSAMPLFAYADSLGNKDAKVSQIELKQALESFDTGGDPEKPLEEGHDAGDGVLSSSERDQRFFLIRALKDGAPNFTKDSKTVSQYNGTPQSRPTAIVRPYDGPRP